MLSSDEIEASNFADINSKRLQLLLRIHHAYARLKEQSKHHFDEVFVRPIFDTAQPKTESSILMSTSIAMSISILEALGTSSKHSFTTTTSKHSL